MFDFLKEKAVLKEVVKVLFVVMKGMMNTGLLKLLKEAGSIEIFRVDGSIVVGINSDKPELAKDVIPKLGEELKKLNMATCSLQFENDLITVLFNDEHRKEMSRVVV